MDWRDVLRVLVYNEWISSKELCEKFNVSRTAVWKHINYLKEKGFKIDSNSKKGYKLIFPADSPLRLTTEDFKGLSFGKKILSFITIDSTNTYAHKIGEESKEGTLVIAEEQKSGRGRRGRIWFSPFGKNLYFSIILKPQLVISILSRLTIVIGVSVAEALKEFGVYVKLKWPNDIMIGDKKIGGILSELYSEGELAKYVILGIGLNVHSEEGEFPDELKNIAGSIYSTTGKKINRAELLFQIVKKFEKNYNTYVYKEGDIEEFKEVWENIAYGKDKEVLITTGSSKEIGLVLGLKSDGALLAKINGMLREIYSGEILVNIEKSEK